MDLSKLPKLSQTPAPPSPAAPAPTALPPQQMPQQVHHPVGIAGMVWFNAIIGLLLVWMGQNFGKYVLSLITGQPYHTGFNWQSGPKAGQEVAYPDLENGVMWTDASLFLFGVAILAEAVVLALASRQKASVALLLTNVAIGLTVLSTLISLAACAQLFRLGVLPHLSLLAAAFGGYMVAYLWRLRAAYTVTQ